MLKREKNIQGDNNIQMVKGKKYFIVGTGITGNSFVQFCKQHQLSYESLLLEKNLASSKELLDRLSCGVVGITPSLDPFWKDIFLTRKISYISDVDIFLNQVQSKNIILVTGTNGKTTTVELLAYFLRKLKKGSQKVHVGGNIGTSLLSLLPYIKKDDYVLLELSSYQLFWSQPEICPKSSLGIITSFDQDHLFWHGSKEHYWEAKNKIRFLTYQVLAQKQAHKVFPGTQEVKRRHRVDSLPHAVNLNRDLVDSAVKFLGFTQEKIHSVDLGSFKNLSARAENISLGKINLVNDAKATNIEALLSLFDFYCHQEKILWILGGDFKGQDLKKLKRLLSFDQMTFAFFGPQIDKLVALGLKSQYQADSFKDLLLILHPDVKRDLYETIILSPGGTSIPEFSGYLELGEYFRISLLKTERI